MISRGFVYCGSSPSTLPDDKDFITLSGVNFDITVYDRECPTPESRFAVVFGSSFGNEWLRVIQDSDEGESWGQYSKKIYNQISMAGPHHTVRSTRDSPHVHLSWAEWDGCISKLAVSCAVLDNTGQLHNPTVWSRLDNIGQHPL